MYLLSSVWFQWQQHLVVRPEHWPPIEQSLHLLIKFFVLFIIRNQNIGSTSHSWRVRRTPFLLRLLTHWFHNAKVCAVFFLPKERGTAGSSTKWRHLRTEWGREFHTVLMTRHCPGLIGGAAWEICFSQTKTWHKRMWTSYHRTRRVSVWWYWLCRLCDSSVLIRAILRWI